MNLKSILKSIKMHESSISTVLGFIIIVIIGLLVVNYFRQSNQGDTFPEGATVTENSILGNKHTVASGETLWTISEQYYGTGFEWERIREANNIENGDGIEEGQVLTIPEINAEEPTAAVTPVATATVVPSVITTATVAPSPVVTPEVTIAPTVTEAPKPEVVSPTDKNYTVKHGDNLWKIAVEVYGDGYRWSDIAKANKLVNPSVIHSGNVLVLPQ